MGWRCRPKRAHGGPDQISVSGTNAAARRFRSEAPSSAASVPNRLLGIVGWERSYFMSFSPKEFCNVPLARFPKQRISYFWKLWDEFAEQSKAMMKPVMLPTTPMNRLFLVNKEFAEYLHRRDFFSSGATVSSQAVSRCLTGTCALPSSQWHRP